MVWYGIVWYGLNPYVYVSIIRGHVVGMELRPYGKNT